MKRLIALVALVPTAALAHPGAHGQDFWGNLAHALGQSDHLAAGVAALALPQARRRFGTERVVGLGTLSYALPLAVLPLPVNARTAPRRPIIFGLVCKLFVVPRFFLFFRFVVFRPTKM